MPLLGAIPLAVAGGGTDSGHPWAGELGGWSPTHPAVVFGPGLAAGDGLGWPGLADIHLCLAARQLGTRLGQRAVCARSGRPRGAGSRPSWLVQNPGCRDPRRRPGTLAARRGRQASVPAGGHFRCLRGVAVGHYHPLAAVAHVSLVNRGLGNWFAVGHACHVGGGVAGYLYARWILRPGPTLSHLREERNRREAQLRTR